MPMDTKTLILEASVRLFARRGYNAVSLRDIAGEVGIRAPALYNHFANKEALYLAAVRAAFSGKAVELSAVLASAGPPRERLRAFVACLCRLAAQDQEFLMLMQRELLDGDEPRLRRLVEEVFRGLFEGIRGLAQAIDPGCDAHLLTFSITGLVLRHFESAPLRRLLPGYRPEHEEPGFVADHITRILFQGVTADHAEPN